MVTVAFDPLFKRPLERLKHAAVKERVAKLVRKIAENPDIGKPMRFSRKGAREVYLPPFRLSYRYFKEEDMMLLIELCRKDEQ